jgi:hypothetical protein
MKRPLVLVPAVLALAAALAAVLVGGLVLSGVVHRPGSGDSARPPCAQLPPLSDVEGAIERHPGLVRDLEAAGPLVSVRAASPCRGGLATRGLVEVGYSSDGERRRIDATLTSSAGFSAPVQLVRR